MQADLQYTELLSKEKGVKLKIKNLEEGWDNRKTIFSIPQVMKQWLLIHDKGAQAPSFWRLLLYLERK
jgi:hypothetical protein